MPSHGSLPPAGRRGGSSTTERGIIANNLNDADDEASLLLLSLINSWPFADPIDETAKELHEFYTYDNNLGKECSAPPKRT